MESQDVSRATFRYPISTRKVVLATSLICLGILSAILWSDPGTKFRDLVIFVCVALPQLYLNLEMWLSEVQVDDVGIVRRLPLTTRTLQWGQVEDLVIFPRLILLRGRGGKDQMRLHRGEYGFSLEPFEEMRDLIRSKAEPLLLERWRRIPPGNNRFYQYPPVSLAQIGGYVVCCLLVAYAFVFVPIESGLFRLEQVLFLAASLFVVGLFFVRDFRKSQRHIVLGEDGLREVNGSGTSLRYEEIAGIVVRPPLFGSGSLVMRGRDDTKLSVPLGIRPCGEFLFLLSVRSQGTITYGQGYG